MTDRTEQPMLDGKPTTWGQLAKITGLTRQGAKHRYTRLAAYIPRASITTADITGPIQDPAVQQQKASKAEQELRAKIAKFVFMHGPTHAAMEFNLPKETVEAIAAPFRLRL